MKKLLILFLLISTLAGHAQINYSFCLTPSASTSTDSVTMVATLLASDGYNYIAWADSAGPIPVLIPSPANSWGNNMLEQSVLTIHKLIPGQYIFKATGVSLTGNSGSLVCKVTVLPAPPQRTVTTITVPFLGQTITIPATALPAGAVKFNDGSNQ